MSFDLQNIRAATDRHGSVTRIVIAAVEGSAPREPGAAMLVWHGGQSGTIGGGALEFEAARQALEGPYCRKFALGPAMGQCCGGAVTLVAETYTSSDLDHIENYHLRRVEGSGEVPPSIRKALLLNEKQGARLEPLFDRGWLLEPLRDPARQLWVYGAGHVGRAIIGVAAPLPDFAITWVDTTPSRFPHQIPDRVTQLVAENPADLVRYAPRDAEHLILTYSHALDLDLCHRLLGHGFLWAGLIGSATKWARFRKRLEALGHRPERIARIACPIGDTAFGKHPQAIALGVVTGLLSPAHRRLEQFGETA